MDGADVSRHVEVESWRVHKIDPLEEGDYLHVSTRHVRLWGTFNVNGAMSDIGALPASDTFPLPQAPHGSSIYFKTQSPNPAW